MTTGKEKDVVAMENGGNKKVVAIFEGKINFDTPKPDGFSDSKTREIFIRAKYEQRLYYNENSMAKEESKSNSGGGLTLKASKADTASTFDAFGFGEEQSAGQRRQRRASMTMMVSSSTSNHKQREPAQNFNESFVDDADEFGGDGDDDEWWEPFDANGAGGDPFGAVQTHAQDPNKSSSWDAGLLTPCSATSASKPTPPTFPSSCWTMAPSSLLLPQLNLHNHSHSRRCLTCAS